MSEFDIDMRGVTMPTKDGDVLEFTNPEAAAAKQYFDPQRRVVFINGMDNSADAHARSALALSLVQMCTVIGVYNKTAGKIADLAQCLGDKLQFNGPVSFGARTKVVVGSLLHPERSREDLVKKELARNEAAVALFDLLRSSRARRAEIFAHSQGNLILSNALQAIEALDGKAAIAGRVVHTFGSPAANWPKVIQRREHGFTWDPVTWLAGFDRSLSISKVGMPKNSLQPITHSFLEYLEVEPEFVVNRFRIGALRMTFSMDEMALAGALVQMGVNIPRVRRVFEHLELRHGSDVDDIAVAYVEGVEAAGNGMQIKMALKADRALVALLIRVMEKGWTGGDEKRAIGVLRAL